MVIDDDSVVSDLLCLLQEKGVPFSSEQVDCDLVQALSSCIDVTSEQNLLLQSLQFFLALREGRRDVAWRMLALLEEKHPKNSFIHALSKLLAASYGEEGGAPPNISFSMSDYDELQELCQRAVG